MKRKKVVNKELEKRDRALYFKEDANQSYVEKHNNFVIEQVIAKTEATRLEKIRQAVDSYGERADAVVHFLKAVDRGKESNINRYFGRRTLAMLRGEEIRQKLMVGMEIRDKNGFIIKRRGAEVPDAPKS